jgi:hypothetical protein
MNHACIVVLDKYRRFQSWELQLIVGARPCKHKIAANQQDQPQDA